MINNTYDETRIRIGYKKMNIFFLPQICNRIKRAIVLPAIP